LSWEKIEEVEDRGDRTLLLDDGRVFQTFYAYYGDPKPARIYNPKRDRWADIGMSITPNVRGRGLARTAEGWVLATGGMLGNAPTATCELWKANAWFAMPDLPEPLHQHACVTVHARSYVIGGTTRTQYGAWPALDTVWSWEPGEDAWREEPSLPFPIDECTAIVLDDHSIVVHGTTRQDANTVRWDGTQWTPIGKIKASAMAAMRGGGLLEIGSNNGDEALAAVRAWTSEHGWQPRPALPKPRMYGAATRLADGRIAVIGGRYTTKTWEDTSTGGELDYEYRSFYTWVVNKHAHDTVLIERGDGWEEIPSPKLDGRDVFTLPDGRVIADMEWIWTPPT
jgi:hypothetical protein